MITLKELRKAEKMISKAHYYINSGTHEIQQLKNYSKTLLLSYYPNASIESINTFAEYCIAYQTMILSKEDIIDVLTGGEI